MLPAAAEAKEGAAMTASPAAVNPQPDADAAGRQAKADEAAQQGQTAGEPHKQEQPANTKVSCADPGQQRHQAAEDTKAETRRLSLACASARVKAKKDAAKWAQAEPAEASKAKSVSAERSHAKQPAEAGKAKTQKADSAIDETPQARKPAAGKAKAKVAKTRITGKAEKVMPDVEAQETDSVHAERSPAKRPTAGMPAAEISQAQKTGSAQAENSQAGRSAATQAAKRVEAHKDDAAGPQPISQAHQTLAPTAKAAARADASAEREQLEVTRLIPEADGQQSNASAAGHLQLVTAAAAASSEDGEELAGTPSMAVGVGTAAVPVSTSTSHLPLVSVQDDGRSCRVIAGAFLKCIHPASCEVCAV